MQSGDQKHEPHWTYDVPRQYLGSIYAKALLGVTEKRGTSEAVVEELAEFVAVLEKLPKFAAVLTSPRIPVEDKLRMLDKAFPQMDRDLLVFLKVTARRGRLDCIREILHNARQQLNELRNRVKVALETAVPLDEQQQDQIRSRLRQMLHKDVVLECSVRPELLAGLVIRIGDTVYDASAVRQLERLQDAIVQRVRQSLKQGASALVGA